MDKKGHEFQLLNATTMLKYWISRIFYLLGKKQVVSTLASHKDSRYEETPDKILPEISIEELTDDSEPALIEATHQNGNVSVEELRCIAKIVKFHQPSSMFEIGTFDGRTTMNMALNAKDATLFTLDLPKEEIHKTRYRVKKGDLNFIDKNISGARFIGTEFESQISQIYADSAQYDYAPHHNNIDVIFIDGAHTYEYVISDTVNARKLLRNGKGVLIWHDYGWREVITALNEFYKEDTYFSNLKNIKGTSLAYLHVQ